MAARGWKEKGIEQLNGIASLSQLGVKFLCWPKFQPQTLKALCSPYCRDVTGAQYKRHIQHWRPRGRKQAIPRPPWLRLYRAGLAGILTGNCVFIADAFINAAPEFLASISGDIVVTYVVQRNVAHCKAQTHTELLLPRTQPPAGNSTEWGLEGETSEFVLRVLSCF